MKNIKDFSGFINEGFFTPWKDDEWRVDGSFNQNASYTEKQARRIIKNHDFDFLEKYDTSGGSALRWSTDKKIDTISVILCTFDKKNDNPPTWMITFTDNRRITLKGFFLGLKHPNFSSGNWYQFHKYFEDLEEAINWLEDCGISAKVRYKTLYKKPKNQEKVEEYPEDTQTWDNYNTKKFKR
jgi:hypothetical protein